MPGLTPLQPEADFIKNDPASDFMDGLLAKKKHLVEESTQYSYTNILLPCEKFRLKERVVIFPRKNG